jgi:hypothetical protein
LPDHIVVHGNARFTDSLHTSSHVLLTSNPLPCSALPWRMTESQ